jgi:hypothetical protein
MLLNRDQMLKVEGRKFKLLDVPELGGQIRIASLSAGCGLKLKALGESKPDDSDRQMALAMFESSIVDAAGAPMLDAQAAESFLNAVSPEAMTLIVQEITALSRSKVPANGAESAEVPLGNPSVAAVSGSSPSA